MACEPSEVLKVTPTDAAHAAGLEQRYSLLKHYMGDIAFGSMGRAFLSQCDRAKLPARKIWDSLPNFLSNDECFKRKPEITELARLELALHQACDADDLVSLTLPELEKDEFPGNVKLHPSAQQLKFFQNTTSIWSALKCEELPPKPHTLQCPQYILVWRQGNGARFRILGKDEALALEEIKNLQRNPFLRGWVEAELLLPNLAPEIFEK